MPGQMIQTVALLLALSCGALGQGQGLSEEDEQEILDAHNYYRRTVDPISTNMLIMVGIGLGPRQTTSMTSFFDRSGMMSWPTWLSSGPLPVVTWKMRIATANRPTLTTWERALRPPSATLSTTRSSSASCGMERRGTSTTTQQAVMMRMGMQMMMEAMKPVEDTHR